VGDGIALHGHGLRSRQLRGPPSPGATPAVTEILARRYQCQRCDAVITVAPAETLTRRLYSAASIAWALALYGLRKLTAAAVRELVSPWRVVGDSSLSRWRTLERWCAAMRAGRLFSRVPPVVISTARTIAAAAATAISAFAIPPPDPPPLDVLAFHGAARAA
jgi:hypothetical protein